MALSQRVLATETSVAGELRRICEMGHFPHDDLVAIRAEYRILMEERQALFAEDGEERPQDGETGKDGGRGNAASSAEEKKKRNEG